MKNLIIVAVVALFSAQAFGVVKESARGNKGNKSAQELREEAKKAVVVRDNNAELTAKRAELNKVINEIAQVEDMIQRGQANSAECNVVCMSALRTLEGIVRDPAKTIENDPESAKTVSEVILRINQEIVKGTALGIALSKAAAELGLNLQEFIEACKA